MTATTELRPATAQHRGHHRDPVGAALKALVVSGHCAVPGLLGLLVSNQQTQHRPVTTATMPDTESPA
ncbi:hypothetical protein [Kitasatospora sp. NPDC059599]|uniref:hypothetical protein n=1 Tax=Kitasatospora sp. NPDC059599 TaxID=3346880 RepID=UPI0036A127F2